MLHLGRLRTFREVVTRQSFSAAADALGYTQSSVSQQIAVLERELGAPLVDRAARPVRPTPAGTAVLEQAETLLGDAQAIEREIAALVRGETGRLRLGGFFTAWATFVPRAVAVFAKAHPGVQLELRQLEPPLALRELRAGELDVAVVYGYDDDERDERRRWTHLLDDPWAVVMSRTHRLAKRKTIALDALADEPWVSPPPSFSYTKTLLALCAEHGFTPRVEFETADIAMAQPLVAAGLAVALLPALSLQPPHPGVAVRRLAGTEAARGVWAVEAGAHRLPAAAAIVSQLQLSCRVS